MQRITFSLLKSVGGGRIDEYLNGGGSVTFASGFNYLQGLAFDNAGNLYAADFLAQTVYKFDTNGTRSVYIGPNAFVPAGQGSNPSGPSNLAFDSSGNLFVSTYEAGGATPGFTGETILRFTPGGSESTFAPNLYQPEGIRFDNAGNLFVAEGGNTGAPGTKVLEFTAGGMQSTFASGLDGPTDIIFEPSISAVPEPTTWLLGALATLALVAAHLRTYRPRV
jgi:hypothetical protein